MGVWGQHETTVLAVERPTSCVSLSLLTSYSFLFKFPCSKAIVDEMSLQPSFQGRSSGIDRIFAAEVVLWNFVSNCRKPTIRTHLFLTVSRIRNEPPRGYGRSTSNQPPWKHFYRSLYFTQANVFHWIKKIGFTGNNPPGKPPTRAEGAFCQRLEKIPLRNLEQSGSIMCTWVLSA